MVAAVVAAALAAAAPADAAPEAPSALAGASAARTDRGHARDVCATASAGSAACHAQVRVDADGVPNAGAAPAAGSYGPVELRAAYPVGVPVPDAGGRGPLVAVVDAYDNPNVEADLAAYRTRYGLGACASAGGCFTKVNQRGQVIGGGSKVRPPRGDVGWGQEIDLDVQMVSALCPACRILLVEADDASFGNLGVAVNRAVAMGAVAVSNSYGAGEFAGETALDGYYDHPGVAVTASTGDAGYGVQYPAASAAVTAVGGTSLTRAATDRGWDETAWSGAGSGCSAYVPRPARQTDAVGTGCARRAVADLAAVADPATGVAVYDSYGSRRGANWYVFGGTSVAAPLVASAFAIAGHLGGGDVVADHPYLPGAASALFDVPSGSNGTCPTAVWCTARAGWDGPTGLGTPVAASAL